MLPQIIEYLSSQGLCRPARTQYKLPMIPALTQLSFSISPPLGVYAAVKYGITYNCVPGTLYLEVTVSGDKYVEGTVEIDLMREIVPYWIVYTIREPITLVIWNLSPLQQFLIATQFEILIDTDVAMEKVKKEMAALSASESISLSKQANALLSAIYHREPLGTLQPRPPLGEG